MKMVVYEFAAPKKDVIHFVCLASGFIKSFLKLRQIHDSWLISRMYEECVWKRYSLTQNKWMLSAKNLESYNTLIKYHLCQTLELLLTKIVVLLKKSAIISMFTVGELMTWPKKSFLRYRAYTSFFK